MALTSKRLRPIQQIAENRERKAAAALGERLRARQEAAQRLQELQGYRQEYMDRYIAAGQRGMSVAQIRDYQAFLDKLDVVIREQERVVERAEAACEQGRTQWQAQYTKTRIMSQVMTQTRSREEAERDKQEQKLQDERNQRRVRQD